MSEQKTFTDSPPIGIGSSNEPHMALLFLLDVSSSMSGDPIQSLNESINKFKEQVCSDPRTTEILDVAIVTFNHSTQVVMPFTPISLMEPINLTASGNTTMAPAVQIAVDMVDERSRFYRHCGTEPYKPWIVLISDGYGGDVSDIAAVVREKEANGFLKFWALGVGSYDEKALGQLTSGRVLELKGYNFTGFINWVNKSMRAVSVSAPGDKLRLDDLPEDVDKKNVDNWL